MLTFEYLKDRGIGNVIGDYDRLKTPTPPPTLTDAQQAMRPMILGDQKGKLVSLRRS